MLSKIQKVKDKITIEEVNEHQAPNLIFFLNIDVAIFPATNPKKTKLPHNAYAIPVNPPLIISICIVIELLLIPNSFAIIWFVDTILNLLDIKIIHISKMTVIRPHTKKYGDPVIGDKLPWTNLLINCDWPEVNKLLKAVDKPIIKKLISIPTIINFLLIWFPFFELKKNNIKEANIEPKINTKGNKVLYKFWESTFVLSNKNSTNKITNNELIFPKPNTEVSAILFPEECCIKKLDTPKQKATIGILINIYL